MWIPGSKAQARQFWHPGICCSAAFGMLLDKGLNPCLLHSQMDSLAPSHQQSSSTTIFRPIHAAANDIISFLFIAEYYSIVYVYHIFIHSQPRFLHLFYALDLDSGQTDLKLKTQFSRSVMSDSLQPQGLQHNRPLCPSPTPRACSNSCPPSR